MSDAVVILDRNGPVAEITLNRPHAHNAISPEVACRLVDIFDEIRRDPTLRVAIVTGAGPSFCAGGDLRVSIPLLSRTRAPANEWEARVAQDLSILVRSVRRDIDFDKPIIAAVNGPCLAGGAELLVSTDIRIASERATFGLPEARHGLIPFAGALVRLTEQIPYCHAMQMLLTAEPISAPHALRIGLINEMVASEEVLPRARAVASLIARNGPFAVQTIKRTILESVGRRLAEQYALEDTARLSVMASADAVEGPKAFFEKREAVFAGR
jgi:enoyl-CoA hydratase